MNRGNRKRIIPPQKKNNEYQRWILRRSTNMFQVPIGYSILILIIILLTNDAPQILRWICFLNLFLEIIHMFYVTYAVLFKKTLQLSQNYFFIYHFFFEFGSLMLLRIYLTLVDSETKMSFSIPIIFQSLTHLAIPLYHPTSTKWVIFNYLNYQLLLIIFMNFQIKTFLIHVVLLCVGFVMNKFTQDREKKLFNAYNERKVNHEDNKRSIENIPFPLFIIDADEDLTIHWKNFEGKNLISKFQQNLTDQTGSKESLLVMFYPEYKQEIKMRIDEIKESKTDTHILIFPLKSTKAPASPNRTLEDTLSMTKSFIVLNEAGRILPVDPNINEFHGKWYELRLTECIWENSKHVLVSMNEVSNLIDTLSIAKRFCKKSNEGLCAALESLCNSFRLEPQSNSKSNQIYFELADCYFNMINYEEMMDFLSDSFNTEESEFLMKDFFIFFFLFGCNEEKYPNLHYTVVFQENEYFQTKLICVSKRLLFQTLLIIIKIIMQEGKARYFRAKIKVNEKEENDSNLEVIFNIPCSETMKQELFQIPVITKELLIKMLAEYNINNPLNFGKGFLRLLINRMNAKLNIKSILCENSIQIELNIPITTTFQSSPNKLFSFTHLSNKTVSSKENQFVQWSCVGHGLYKMEFDSRQKIPIIKIKDDPEEKAAAARKASPSFLNINCPGSISEKHKSLVISVEEIEKNNISKIDQSKNISFSKSISPKSSQDEFMKNHNVLKNLIGLHQPQKINIESPKSSADSNKKSVDIKNKCTTLSSEAESESNKTPNFPLKQRDRKKKSSLLALRNQDHAIQHQFSEFKDLNDSNNGTFNSDPQVKHKHGISNDDMDDQGINNLNEFRNLVEDYTQEVVEEIINEPKSATQNGNRLKQISKNNQFYSEQMIKMKNSNV